MCNVRTHNSTMDDFSLLYLSIFFPCFTFPYIPLPEKKFVRRLFFPKRSLKTATAWILASLCFSLQPYFFGFRDINIDLGLRYEYILRLIKRVKKC